ncbi:MAG: hypothetical protein HOW73_00665 [Polyangiaceae bacterium]|nr:hypothetical protein [Polyangiaceae bacterium]
MHRFTADDDDHDEGLDEPLGIDPDSDTPDTTPGKSHEEDPLGPREEDEEALEDDSDRSLEDAYSDDLDIGGVDIAFEEGALGKRVDDTAGIEHDVDDFAPSFDDGASEAGDEPVSELATDDGVDLLPSTADDGGAEGIGDGSEAEVDEAALPAMDADAGGDFELNDLLEEMGFGGAEPWESVPQLSRDDALACVTSLDGLILAAGSAVVVVDRGALSPRVRPLASAAHGCALTSGGVVLATARGVETIAAAATSAPKVLFAQADVGAIAVAAATLWVLAGTRLFRVDPASGANKVVRDDVLTMSAAQGTLFVGTSSPVAALERLRGDDGAFEPLDCDAATEQLLEAGATIAASSPGHLVLVHEGRGLLVRVGGASLPLPRERIVAATFRGHTDAALLLLVRAGEGLEMVSIDAHGAEVSAVKVMSPASGDAYAIAWDATREIALIAGPQGLAAMRPRLQH